MKRLIALIATAATLSIIAGILVAGPYSFAAYAHAATLPPRAQYGQVSNLPLLLNPGYENGFHAPTGEGELSVANDWHPFYDNLPPMRRPEFQRESTTTGRARVRTGESAQKLFTTFSPHDGGIYQEVHQVTPGAWYTFSAWGYQWSSTEHNPDVSKQDGKCSLLVGINPWGDANPLARTTVWGKEALQVYNVWTALDVTAQAWSPKIVVALRQRCEWGPHHNDGYLDDAQLQLAALTPDCPACPPAVPCACPTCPVEPATCPSLDQIRDMIRDEIDNILIDLAPGPPSDRSSL